MTEAQHIINLECDAALQAGLDFVGGPDRSARRREIAERIHPSRRRVNIMAALVTGWLPWGVDWREPGTDRAVLSLCGRDYILCCGHVLKPGEARKFVAAGFLKDGGTDRHGQVALVCTDAGRVWFGVHWRFGRARAQQWRAKRDPRAPQSEPGQMLAGLS